METNQMRRSVFVIEADLVRTETGEVIPVSYAFHRNARLRKAGVQESDEQDREFDLRDALLDMVDLHSSSMPFRLRRARLVVKRGSRSRAVDPSKSYWTREFFGRTLGSSLAASRRSVRCIVRCRLTIAKNVSRYATVA